MSVSFLTPFSRSKGGAIMSEFSPEDIQRAADDARRGGFGDFMFRDPGHNRRSSRRRTSRRRVTSRRRISQRRMTSRRITSRRVTSRNLNTSRKITSRRHTSRRVTSRRRTSRRNPRLVCSDWRNTTRGNEQSKSCWKDGNMWEFRLRKLS